MVRTASKELETFIDEALRECLRGGYRPVVFQGMRRRHGTIGTIERLVLQGKLQSGFGRLQTLGMLQWSIETAVVKLPEEFSHNATAYTGLCPRRLTPNPQILAGSHNFPPHLSGLPPDPVPPLRLQC